MRSQKNCPFCSMTKPNIDHYATRCKNLLATHYESRHNYILKCVHFNLVRKYGFTNSKKLSLHNTNRIIENQNAKVIVEMPCKTNINKKNNKPDITVYDKKTGEILLIEIGITSLENLKEREFEKLNKYRLLAK
ncbi:hypothetical protein DMUE_5194 [Dictyocoela muelleri]|nr:hypothetical protein DMUE_5194 [Dictyocoela muelleri]